MIDTIAKLLIIAVIVAAGWWAYHNFEIGKVEICVGTTMTKFDVSCKTNTDCASSLLTAYSSYPNTELFAKILLEVTQCKTGTCYVQTFDFKKNKPAFVCGANETLKSYPSTFKDMVSAK